MGIQKNSVTAARQVKISENALKNINEITGYLAFIKHAPINAIRVGDKIFDTIQKIENNPLAYKECEELKTKVKTYRRAICLSWQIIYKLTQSEIIILGVIHSSRKPSALRRLRKLK